MAISTTRIRAGNSAAWYYTYAFCEKNLGPATDSPPRWWPVDLGRGSFRFRDPADQLWFRLRWGE